MRKFLALGLVLTLAAALFPAAAVQAQGGGALEFGVWAEGALTANEYEHIYTFQGTAGSLVLIEMLTKPGTYDLDPAMLLKDAAGTVLADNDDFNGLDAMVVFEVPADGEYTVLATRSSGATGSSEGEYILRVSEATLLGAGASVEATVDADYEKDVADIFIIRPETSGTWAFSYAQPEGELRASIRINSWPESDSVLYLQDTSGSRSGTLNIDLEAGAFYVVSVQQSLYSFVWDDISIQVVISLAEAG